MIVDAALTYIARGFAVFPMSRAKRPLTAHGLHDATRDSITIKHWWKRWPGALIAVAAGEVSGIVALDIDRHAGAVDGSHTLDELGVHIWPTTAMAHTPSGGFHLLFRWPGRFVKSVANALGPGLDIRDDGGSLILPPGPDRSWDPHYGFDTPLAPMPAWMISEPLPERAQTSATSAPRLKRRLSAYAAAALDDAVAAICDASAGQQRETLNRECYGIGQLVGGDIIPAGYALDSLMWAARQMPSHDPRRPWRSCDLNRVVQGAFHDGMRRPRELRS